MKTFRDVVGHILVEGDYVATTITNYSGLRICKIIGFTPQKIRVQQLRPDYEGSTITPQLKEWNQVCFVNSDEVALRILKGKL